MCVTVTTISISVKLSFLKRTKLGNRNKTYIADKIGVGMAREGILRSTAVSQFID